MSLDDLVGDAGLEEPVHVQRAGLVPVGFGREGRLHGDVPAQVGVPAASIRRTRSMLSGIPSPWPKTAIRHRRSSDAPPGPSPVTAARTSATTAPRGRARCAQPRLPRVRTSASASGGVGRPCVPDRDDLTRSVPRLGIYVGPGVVSVPRIRQGTGLDRASYAVPNRDYTSDHHGRRRPGRPARTRRRRFTSWTVVRFAARGVKPDRSGRRPRRRLAESASTMRAPSVPSAVPAARRGSRSARGRPTSSSGAGPEEDLGDGTI